MTKQNKIKEIKKVLEPSHHPIIACAVKHYRKNEEPKPNDLVSTWGGEKMTIREFKELPVRNLLVVIIRRVII